MASAVPKPVLAALRAADTMTVLTGAGISAASGIPTFRDALTGIWARFRPEELATPEAFERNPELIAEWYAWRRDIVRRAQPNAGHRALADLEDSYRRLTVVTQNIDELHQRAGSTDVIELHGSILRDRCPLEGTVVESPAQASEVTGEQAVVPRCPDCGAVLRPDVVWFGEMLPQGALEAAHHATRSCDLFLSVGTSNLVYPAAALPWMASERGIPVIVINPDLEGQEHGPTIHHIAGRAAEVLPLLAEAMRK